MAEAGVAFAAVRVEDPERGPATRRAGPIAGDDHLRSLADHVPTEPEPRSTDQLEANPGRLADGRRDARDEPRRLEDDEADPRPPGERREPAETVGDASGALEARREVDDEDVDGPAREQRAGDRQPLLGVGRGQDHEPLRPDPPGDGLDGVEGRGEVQPGGDGAGGLGLRDEPQGERGPPAREVAPEGQAEAPRQAAGAEDGVELREPGRDDPGRIPLGPQVRRLERHRRQRADDLRDRRRQARRRGRAPLRPEGRQGRRHVRGEHRHRQSIEQMFE